MHGVSSEEDRSTVTSRICDKMNSEQLAAWVDGEVSNPRVDQKITAHIADCVQCAAYTAAIRAHKERMGQFAATTLPATVPVNFWENVRIGMDQADAARHIHPSRPPKSLHRLKLAGLMATAMLFGVLVFAFFHLRPHPPVPLERLQSTSIVAPMTDSDDSFLTKDADQAAHWLGQQLGADISTVNLSLNGVETIGAAANREGQQGTLFYRDAHGQPVALHIFLRGRTDLARLPAVRYNGVTYHFRERIGSNNALVAWETQGRFFVAAAPTTTSNLLPLAHEMNRRCQRP